MKFKKRQEGQTILIVLLMTSVILTIGLSVVSRSITDIRISNQTQESARAFWFAQGQLDQAIKTNSSISNASANGVTYSVVKSDIGGGNTLAFPNKINEGRIFNLWLAEHSSDGNFSGNYYQGNQIIVYFGNYDEFGGQTPGDSFPAIEATLIYKGTNGIFYSRRFPFDSYSGRGNNFSTVTAEKNTIDGKDLAFKAIIDFTAASPAPLPFYGSSPNRNPYMLTLKLLFNTNPQYVAAAADSGKTIYTQGSLYSSTATIDSSKISRKVTEFRTWSGVPEVFNYLLYSGGDITAQ